jgi:hypothetical protein
VDNLSLYPMALALFPMTLALYPMTLVLYPMTLIRSTTDCREADPFDFECATRKFLGLTNQG